MSVSLGRHAGRYACGNPGRQPAKPGETIFIGQSELGGGRAAHARASAAGPARAAERAQLLQSLSGSEAQRRELEEQKGLAVGSGNFKEAARSSSAEKALAVEEAQSRERAEMLRGQIEAATPTPPRPLP